jgi:integrase
MRDQHITQELVERWAKEPRTSKGLYWSRDVPGFGAVISTTGRVSYAIQYRVGGKSRRLKIEVPGKPTPTLQEALFEARLLLDRVGKGHDPIAERAKAQQESVALREVLADYMRLDGNRLRSARRVQAMFRDHILPTLGDKPIGDIKRQGDIVPLLRGIVARGEPALARSVRTHLSTLFKWHVDQTDSFINPLAGGKNIGSIPKEQKRTRVLSEGELSAIWRACDEWKQGERQHPYALLIQFIALTGTRIMEPAHMTREEVDAEGKTWVIPAARYKTGRDTLIPLSRSAQSILKGVSVGLHHARPRSFLFSLDGGETALGGIAKWKAQLDQRSGVQEWVTHDLRRTCATLAARQHLRIPEHIQRRMLGHVPNDVHGSTYNMHTYEGELRKAFEALAKEVARIVREPVSRELPVYGPAVKKKRARRAPEIVPVPARPMFRL